MSIFCLLGLFAFIHIAFVFDGLMWLLGFVNINGNMKTDKYRLQNLDILGMIVMSI